MKTQILAVVLAAVPAAAWAVQGKSVSDHALPEAGQEIRIAVDSADLIVESSASASLTYQVDFVTESVGIFSSGPSQKAYDSSTASFDRKTGVLNIHAADGLVARARIFVPDASALAVSVKTGKATVNARAGKTVVDMDNGLLTFDASKIPASSCFETTVDNGLARGRKARSCANPTAIIHLQNGIVTVE